MHDTLMISRLPTGRPEIFRSIQGEGPSLGTSSTFVRLAGCNLRCSWCDTAYTWDWETFDREKRTVSMSVSDVLSTVTDYGVQNVVITGGEPLLQKALLGDLARGLKALDHTIEIETNGTVAPSAELIECVGQWNVSPKLRNSGEPLERRENSSTIAACARTPTAVFKFVICDANDVDEVSVFVDRYKIAPHRVFLMPEGTTPAAVLAGTRELSTLAAARGFRVTPRLHILLWGDKPGR